MKSSFCICLTGHQIERALRSSDNASQIPTPLVPAPMLEGVVEAAERLAGPSNKRSPDRDLLSGKSEDLKIFVQWGEVSISDKASKLGLQYQRQIPA